MGKYILFILGFFVAGAPSFANTQALDEARALAARGYAVAGDEAFQINDVMQVLSVTYGGNCGIQEGLDTAVMSGCNGYESCNYEVNPAKLHGVPQNCTPDFFVRYICGKDTVERQGYRYPHGGRSTIYLSCRNDHPRFVYKPVRFQRR